MRKSKTTFRQLCDDAYDYGVYLKQKNGRKRCDIVTEYSYAVQTCYDDTHYLLTNSYFTF